MRYLIIICLPLIVLFGCSKDSGVLSPQEKTTYKEIAYNSLTSQEKSTLINPDNAVIVQGNYKYVNGNHKILIGPNLSYYFVCIDKKVVLLNGQTLIFVRFNTANDALLGPIVVIINPITNMVVGGFLRD